MPTNPAPRSAPISAASPQRSSAAAAPAQREPLPEPPEPSYEYSGGPRYRSVRRHPSPTAQTKAAESRSPSRRQDAHQLTFTESQRPDFFGVAPKFAAADAVNSAACDDLHRRPRRWRGSPREARASASGI